MQREPGSTETLFNSTALTAVPSANNGAGVNPPLKPNLNPDDPAENAARVAEIIATHQKKKAPPSASEEFWEPENGDILLHEQRALAVYENQWGEVTLRQEKLWDEED